jgi:hypothetical protein
VAAFGTLGLVEVSAGVPLDAPCGGVEVDPGVVVAERLHGNPRGGISVVLLLVE